MKPRTNALVWSLLIAAAAAAPLATQAPLPKVLVIGTGGTISGEQEQPGTLTGYEMKRSANDLVRAVPVIAQYADVETEEFARISSPTITPEHWVKLANRINQVFKERPELSGIVVTHGTARLEETAFFLYLTVKSDRPVVLAAAQRPATGISADGPLNVLSAIRVAASPRARTAIGRLGLFAVTAARLRVQRKWVAGRERPAAANVNDLLTVVGTNDLERRDEAGFAFQYPDLLRGEHEVIDVLEHDFLAFPVHARIQRRVDGAAIDQHEQLVGKAPTESAGRDRP